MKEAEEKIIKNSERIAKAVKLEKTDRIPVILLGNVALARYVEPTVLTADFVERPKWIIDKAVEAVQSLKYVDGVGTLGAYPGKAFAGGLWLAKMRQPGQELRRDELWQIDEISAMKVEDYDFIIEKGWKAYQKKYFDEYLDVTMDDFIQLEECMQYSSQKLAQIGCANIGEIMAPQTFDCICSGRGIVNFIKDLRKMPDKIKSVLDILLEEQMIDYKNTLSKLPAESIVFVQPAVRGNCDFFSRKVFEKLIFPHFRAQANAALEAGHTVFFHMDSNWDLFLDLFREFPKGRCIFDTDGITDIYKVKEALGDRMCITGNIGAALMSIGTPEEVYNEVKKQIRDLGPEGYIISGACTLPPYTKPENIKALVDACI